MSRNVAQRRNIPSSDIQGKQITACHQRTLRRLTAWSFASASMHQDQVLFRVNRTNLKIVTNNS